MCEAESGKMGKKKVTADSKSNANGANLGFEAKLWLAADRLRNNMVAKLNGQFAESRKLEKAIRSNLEGLGYGG
jgi:hypothetical protein